MNEDGARKGEDVLLLGRRLESEILEEERGCRGMTSRFTPPFNEFRGVTPTNTLPVEGGKRLEADVAFLS